MTCDAGPKHVGGAETAAWEALFEMEVFDQAGQQEEGTVSLVVVCRWCLDFPQRIWSLLCGYVLLMSED